MSHRKCDSKDDDDPVSSDNENCEENKTKRMRCDDSKFGSETGSYPTAVHETMGTFPSMATATQSPPSQTSLSTLTAPVPLSTLVPSQTVVSTSLEPALCSAVQTRPSPLMSSSAESSYRSSLSTTHHRPSSVTTSCSQRSPSVQSQIHQCLTHQLTQVRQRHMCRSRNTPNMSLDAERNILRYSYVARHVTDRHRNLRRNYTYFHVRVNVPLNENELTFVNRVRRFIQMRFVAYTCQLELCPTTNRRHLQMVVNTHPKKTRSNMVHMWCCAFPHLLNHLRNIEGERVEIGPDGLAPSYACRADGAEWYCEPQIFTKQGASKNRYCMKTDTRVAGPWTKGRDTGSSSSNNSDTEDLHSNTDTQSQSSSQSPSPSPSPSSLPNSSSSRPSRASSCSLSHHNTNGNVSSDEEELIVIDPRNFYTWQRDLMRKLVRCPNDRTVYWLYEENGRTGKSQFCKYMCAVKSFPEEYIEYAKQNDIPYIKRIHSIVCGGRAVDMKFAIMDYVKCKKRFPNIVFYDITRIRMEVGPDYQGVEEIKNGCFFSSKFKSGMVLMNSPHIVVFSNSAPDYTKLSADRWEVTRIVPDAAAGAMSDDGYDTEIQEFEPEPE